MALKSPRDENAGKAKVSADSVDAVPVAAPKKDGGLAETVKTVVYAVLFALVVRTFAFEPFNIPSGSMIPTLLVGDYLFVSKYSYGYSKHSFPFSPAVFSGRVFDSPPARGDVAVFKLPKDDSTDYIKRVIGLPGDTVQVISGVLHVNGEPVKRRRIRDYDFEGTRSGGVVQYTETLPNGVEHRLIEENRDVSEWDNTPVYTVPDGHYFMMGDNRDNSLDSRVFNRATKKFDVGFVPAENLVGKAQFLFYSTNGYARIWEIWKWPFTIRYGRLFNGID